MAAKPTEGAGCIALAAVYLEGARPLRPFGAPPRSGEDLGSHVRVQCLVKMPDPAFLIAGERYAGFLARAQAALDAH